MVVADIILKFEAKMSPVLFFEVVQNLNVTFNKVDFTLLSQ